MTPRWTYTEANATRWRHLFDDLIGGTPALEVPLEGNGKSLCSLRIRISDALKWLADQFKAGDASMETYALLKRRIRYTATDSAAASSARPTAVCRNITTTNNNKYNKQNTPREEERREFNLTPRRR